MYDKYKIGGQVKKEDKLHNLKKSLLELVEENDFDTLDFELDEELIDFAKDVSVNFKNLAEGIYHSDNKTYTVEILETFKGIREGGLKTPARVGQRSSLIQLQRQKLLSDYNENFIFYIIIWCIIEFCILDLQKSDTIAMKYYLSNATDKQIKDILDGYVMMLDNNENESNSDRLLNVKNLLSVYNKDIQ
jgi:hypothetical protein